MKRKCALFIKALIIALIGALPITAQHYSYPFLNIPSTAQTVATGGVSLTFIDGNAGLAFENPALYGEETAGRLFLSYYHAMPGVNSANTLYGLPINDRGSWAAGIRAINYGKIEGYDINNNATGAFSATDIAVEGLFSYDLTSKLRGGIALKLIYSNIERYNAFAIATDVGLSYYNGEKGSSIGFAITNAGVTIKGFDKERPLTAWDMRLGYSQSFRHIPFRLHLTAYGLNPQIFKTAIEKELSVRQKIIRHLTLGIEYHYYRHFWVGIGYNVRAAQDLKIMGGNAFSGLSMGVGFNSDIIRCAIAVSRYHPQALGIMATFSTTFGNDQYIF